MRIVDGSSRTVPAQRKESAAPEKTSSAGPPVFAGAHFAPGDVVDRAVSIIVPVNCVVVLVAYPSVQSQW